MYNVNIFCHILIYTFSQSYLYSLKILCQTHLIYTVCKYLTSHFTFHRFTEI